MYSTYCCYINSVSVKSKSYCKVKSLRVCSVNKVNPISINNVLILFHQSKWMSSKVVHKYIYIKMSKLIRWLVLFCMHSCCIVFCIVLKSFCEVDQIFIVINFITVLWWTEQFELFHSYWKFISYTVAITSSAYLYALMKCTDKICEYYVKRPSCNTRNTGTVLI